MVAAAETFNKRIEGEYQDIKDTLGEEAHKLTKVIIEGFTQGLPKEQRGNVDRDAANDRTREYFLEKVRSGEIRFSSEEGREGFLYYNPELEEDAVMARGWASWIPDVDSRDPLTPRVVEVAMMYHKEVGVAQEHENAHGRHAIDVGTAIQAMSLQIAGELTGREYRRGIDQID